MSDSSRLGILTDAELAAADYQEGEIIVPESPRLPDSGSDDDENAKQQHDVDMPPVVARRSQIFTPPQQGRKRGHSEMEEREEPVLMHNPARDLRNAFALVATDDSFLDSSTVDGQNGLPECGATPLSLPRTVGEKDEEVSRVLPPLEDAVNCVATRIDKFCSWKATQKENVSSAKSMKAVVAFMTTSPATSIFDFDPFKMPLILPKGITVVYLQKILKQKSLLELVEMAGEDDMNATCLSTELALIPLNAMAFNDVHDPVSNEARRMLHFSVAWRKKMEMKSRKSNISQDHLDELRMKVRDRRNRSLPVC
ncbi:hypothetical protein BV898_00700 [Hypsibius exemplaris]|uniref:Uncharacterized protein n=1 Tax=Hypsibius exemplaris TaxID=2072580 RepID=A0A1W0XE83_HYPEX|nr:hypothetical protein BV898_00700 [Hypsibius exemplaris]